MESVWLSWFGELKTAVVTFKSRDSSVWPSPRNHPRADSLQTKDNCPQALQSLSSEGGGASCSLLSGLNLNDERVTGAYYLAVNQVLDSDPFPVGHNATPKV